jgi:hypothetical protein
MVSLIVGSKSRRLISSPCESGSPHTQYLSRSTGNRSTGRCSKPAIAEPEDSLPTLQAHLDFPSPRAKSMATASRISTVVRTRTPRAGLGPGNGPALRFNPADLLRLSALSATLTTHSCAQPQPDGPPWAGAHCPAGFSRCSATPKPSGRTAWNC